MRFCTFIDGKCYSRITVKFVCARGLVCKQAIILNSGVNILPKTMDTYVLVQQSSTRCPQDALGISVEKPKYPQYADSSKRFESFATWPDYLPVGKEELVEAGLVYTGDGDRVRCYHCGGVLKDWEQGDNAMIAHAKWYPKCPHPLWVKGQAFIDKVRNGETVDEDETQNETRHIDSPAALSCIQMGYDKELAQKAIDIYIARHGHCDFKGADLCEILLDMEENPEAFNNSTTADSTTQNDLSSEDLETLREENERLKESNLCKVCVDNRADVIFLPCGHIASCLQCAPVTTKCPFCGKTNKGPSSLS